MLNGNPSRERAQALSLGGAVLAALAASSCCIGPLIVAALGLGGAGAFAVLAVYRPYILGATALLLTIGFYLSYRKPRVAAPDVCGCEKPKASRAGRVGLWMAAALTATLAAAPSLLAGVAHHRPPALLAGQHLEQAVIQVHGIDCEACAAPLRNALTKVGGFNDLRLDLPKQTIAVSYEPAPGRLAAYVAAIDDLGYEASLPDDPVAGRMK
jgi:copper chaperone CopZ